MTLPDRCWCWSWQLRRVSPVTLLEKVKAFLGYGGAAVKAAATGVSTVGAVAGAVSETAKAAGKVADAVHDNNERTAGADHVHAEDNAASAKVNENVANAAVSATDAGALDRLRKGKF
jgi:hypothetical protein